MKTGAQFNVAVSIIPFSYFVQLTFKPEFNTLTWTLDYQYTSDFGIYEFTCTYMHTEIFYYNHASAKSLVVTSPCLSNSYLIAIENYFAQIFRELLFIKYIEGALFATCQHPIHDISSNTYLTSRSIHTLSDDNVGHWQVMPHPTKE